jgi:hypothetical protein
MDDDDNDDNNNITVDPEHAEDALLSDTRPFLELQMFGKTVFVLTRGTYERLPQWMQRAAYDCLQTRKAD